MLNKLKEIKAQKSEQGFTIIEVMIVLAIAGLILLIVLLAVPALQRNSRNTAIKNDASALAGGVTEFASNNDGALPTQPPSAQSGSSVTFNRTGAGYAPATAKVQSSTTVAFTGTPGTPGAIVVRFGQKCSSSTAFTLTPSTRATAVLYLVETPTSTAQRCLDS